MNLGPLSPVPVKATTQIVCAYCGSPHGSDYQPCKHCGASATKAIDATRRDPRHAQPVANQRVEPE